MMESTALVQAPPPPPQTQPQPMEVTVKASPASALTATAYSPPAEERQQFKKHAEESSSLSTPSTMCSSEGSEISTVSSGGGRSSLIVTAPSAPYLSTSIPPQHNMDTTPAGTTTTTTSNSSSISSNNNCSSHNHNSHNLTGNRRSIRLSLPSPSRPRLDPHYASRLVVGRQQLQQQRPSPTSSSGNHRTSSAGSSNSSNHNNPGSATGLIPPPGITRDSDESIFRPTPIIDSHNNMNSSQQFPPCQQQQQPLPPPRQYIFQSTPPMFSSSDRSLRRNSSGSYTSNSACNSPLSSPASNGTATTTFGGSNSNSSSSIRRTSYSSSRRSSSSSLISDVGTSDRFIPSRATSNFNGVNLWDGIGFMNGGGGAGAGRRGGRGGSYYSPSYGGMNSFFGAGTGTHQSHNSNGAAGSGGGSGGAGGGNGAHNTAANGGAGGGTMPDDTSAVAGGATGQTTNADGTDPTSPDGSASPNGRSNDGNSSSQPNLLNVLLRSELLGENLNPYASQYQQQQQQQQQQQSGGGQQAPPIVEPLREGGNYLHFQSPRQLYQSNVMLDEGPTSVVNNFSLTPVRSAASQRLMAAPQKRKRRISKVPFKVLDAPALQDDFYLNLVDWSSQNVLAVGLGSCVYLWSACTSKVTKLCDLAQSEDIVTSVSWAQRGTHLAVGTNRGEVLLWDTIKCKKVRTMAGHSARVGTLAWTGPILASGSRDRLIYLRDVRVQASFTDRLAAHKQEVCGLKWSFDEPSFLASGGNDNQLHVVDSRNPSQPVQRFSDHTAAVKAIAWSPHQHGLLSSGGGTADRCIRFWNTLSGTSLSCVDTGSQVCNLAWSQNCNEIVSTHGYSLNQIVVWRYPSMSKVVTLTGHTYRVLYLAMSPDGSTIVTGAGDETLRFWQVFPGPRSDSKNSSGGLLFPNTLGSVIR